MKKTKPIRNRARPRSRWFQAPWASKSGVIERPRICLVRGAVLGCLSAAALGCSGSDTTGVPPIVTNNFFAAVQLNVRGAAMATMAPYDTLQLVPVAYAADGTPIPQPGPVTYAVSDTALTVSPSGLVQLKHPTGSNSYVICRVQDTVQNVTHADTAFILGTSTVPTAALASFSIQPVGTDSAILDVKGGTKTLPVTVTNTAGLVIPKSALKIHFRSLDVLRATVNATSGVVTAVQPGQVVLTASTTYYGVTKSDSLRLTIGFPDINLISEGASAGRDGTVQYFFYPATLVVGVNKTVIFQTPYVYLGFEWNAGNVLGPQATLPLSSMDVVFDDSSSAQMSPAVATKLNNNYAANGFGNVNLLIPDSVIIAKDSVNQLGYHLYPLLTTYCQNTPYLCAAARAFPSAGTFHYHSVRTGAVGTIVVQKP